MGFRGYKVLGISFGGNVEITPGVIPRLFRGAILNEWAMIVVRATVQGMSRLLRSDSPGRMVPGAGDYSGGYFECASGCASGGVRGRGFPAAGRPDGGR